MLHPSYHPVRPAARESSEQRGETDRPGPVGSSPLGMPDPAGTPPIMAVRVEKHEDGGSAGQAEPLGRKLLGQPGVGGSTGECLGHEVAACFADRSGRIGAAKVGEKRGVVADAARQVALDVPGDVGELDELANGEGVVALFDGEALAGRLLVRPGPLRIQTLGV